MHLFSFNFTTYLSIIKKLKFNEVFFKSSNFFNLNLKRNKRINDFAFQVFVFIKEINTSKKQEHNRLDLKLHSLWLVVVFFFK